MLRCEVCGGLFYRARMSLVDDSDFSSGYDSDIFLACYVDVVVLGLPYGYAGGAEGSIENIAVV